MKSKLFLFATAFLALLAGSQAANAAEPCWDEMVAANRANGPGGRAGADAQWDSLSDEQLRADLNDYKGFRQSFRAQGLQGTPDYKWVECTIKAMESRLKPNSNEASAKVSEGSKSLYDKQVSKYRDGTQCLKLIQSHDSLNNMFWYNGCKFLISVSWIDYGEKNGAGLSAAGPISPGKKEVITPVKGRYTAAACEYPGTVRAPNGERWNPQSMDRHSCR
ncbi:hypothetical protein [Pandoraea sp. SD6-2]|uniref:hypothetical protein n=1 Tax=Pandoraea sp. SD6-2 TaxID=1286093 RepID=UPI0011851290|nr:hypothetical protein [Pandoraea sp. SD6-2]